MFKLDEDRKAGEVYYNEAGARIKIMTPGWRTTHTEWNSKTCEWELYDEFYVPSVIREPQEFQKMELTEFTGGGGKRLAVPYCGVFTRKHEREFLKLLVKLIHRRDYPNDPESAQRLIDSYILSLPSLLSYEKNFRENYGKRKNEIRQENLSR